MFKINSNNVKNIFETTVRGISSRQPLQKVRNELFLKKQSSNFFFKANLYLNALFSFAREKYSYTLLAICK